MLATETLGKAEDRPPIGNTPETDINVSDMPVFLLQDFLDFDRALPLLDTYRDPNKNDGLLIAFITDVDEEIYDNVEKIVEILSTMTLIDIIKDELKREKDRLKG